MAKQKFDAWAAKSPSGTILAGHLAYTRTGVIDSVMETFGPRYTWKKLYRGGWRAVKVNIVPVCQ